MIPHSKPNILEADVEKVASVVRSLHIAQGQVTERLEQEWCRHTASTAAVCVGSGVAALRLSLLALGVGKGDEVVVPAYSCVALLNAVLAVGAQPVLADVELDTWVLSRETVAAVSTMRTKAVIAVHLFGYPAPVPGITELGVPVIEDCAHGIGGMYDKRPFGSAATLNVASFYATKMLGGGEGGIVGSRDPGLIAFVRNARGYADQLPDGRYLNDKMTDMEASLVESQLARLPEILRRRDQTAQRYAVFLEPLEKQGLIKLPRNITGRIWYRYAVRLVHHQSHLLSCRMHEYEVFADQPVWDLRSSHFWSDRLVNSSTAFERVISLPLFPDLSEAEQKFVCHTFANLLNATN